MRPDKDLAGLLGLTDTGSLLAAGYLLIDTSKAPGSGLVGQTIQFRGVADRYSLNGATRVATLYSDATTATTAPAVTVRAVGTNGGKAAAFTYDLARSIVALAALVARRVVARGVVARGVRQARRHRGRSLGRRMRRRSGHARRVDGWNVGGGRSRRGSRGAPTSAARPGRRPRRRGGSPAR